MQATSVSGKDDVTYAELESNTAFPDNFYFHIKIISMFVCTAHVLFQDTVHMPNLTQLLGTIVHRDHF